jgi:hypothetical protein
MYVRNFRKIDFLFYINMSSKEQVKESERMAKQAEQLANETKKLATETKDNARGPGRPPNQDKKK